MRATLRFSVARSARVPGAARARTRGFTLIELLVSLVAGLIIGLAVVTLSKSVANQFHEEVRANAAEASVRLASQRLRTDLSRAGLMSTGNIARDTRAATLPGGTGAKGIIQLQQLSGIRVFTGGSLTPPTVPNTLDATGAGNITAGSGAQTPALTPDSFAVWGNMTSGDEYLGNADPATPSSCGGRRVKLNPDDGALLRLVRDPNGVAVVAAQAEAALQQIFTPIVGQTFFARITDAKGYHHYALTCPVAVTYNGTDAFVHLQNVNAWLDSTQTGQRGGVAGSEEVTVSPIQGVYWYIGRRANPNVENPASVAQSTQKYDLFRAWVNSAGQALVAQAEVVCEFAVDLKIGFTVDDPAVPEGTADKSVTFGFGTTAAARNPWANRDLNAAVPLVPNRGSMGPHRIRGVRYRLSTRTAVPDRTEAFTAPGSDYLYRYRIGNDFARVRVTTGEVALVNQGRMSY